MFWPREVWGNFAKRLEDFKDPAAAPSAVRCLNSLVADALRHAPPALTYMSRLRNRAIFRFCAIPQVMAVATLALCYDNPAVFTGAAACQTLNSWITVLYLPIFSDASVLRDISKCGTM